MPALPIVLLTGYLGSGKTTLLNRLLTHAAGKKIAVLVNDFGSINIDANLIDTAVDGVVALQNGCICCSIADGLHAALFKVFQRDQRPDLIIIEASGVSNTGDLAKVIGDEALWRYAALELVIATLDCGNLPSYLPEELRLTHTNLRYADIVLLTKVDNVNKTDVEQARKLAETVSPGALIFESETENITLDLILGTQKQPSDTVATGKFVASIEVAEPSMSVEETYHSWNYQSKEPLSKDGFSEILRDLPPHTVRGKGFLYLAEYPDEQFSFQMVGKRAKVEPIGRWGEKTPQNQIVFIALKD